MNMEKIMTAVTDHLLDNEHCDYYSDKTNRRIESLMERLDSLTCIDQQFNIQFSNNITILSTKLLMKLLTTACV